MCMYSHVMLEAKFGDVLLFYWLLGVRAYLGLCERSIIERWKCSIVDLWKDSNYWLECTSLGRLISLCRILTHLFPMHPLFAPLKTLEKRKVFWCLQVVEKRCIVNKWVITHNRADFKMRLCTSSANHQVNV